MIQTQSCDWRQQLAKNTQKTIQIMIIFILIYALLGFFVDLYLHGAFIENNFLPTFSALISFQTPPYATFTLGVVAIIALLITYQLSDQLMLLGTQYYEITDKSARDLQEQQLYHVVEELKIAAGLRYMPKVYLIEADYMNAFASGFSEKSAMIAITRGLLNKLERNELQAVIAHELSHIRHGDIKLTLTASVLSNIMLIVIDLLFYNIIFSRNDRRQDNGAIMIVIVLLRYLLPLITVLLMLYLSRSREYMADAGAVELTRDNQPLAKALLKISGDQEANFDTNQAAYCQTAHEDIRRAAYIFDPFTDGVHPIKTVSSLFSTHPSIPDRLKALGFGE